MPKIRVHAPTRELGLAVRSAVSKAWDAPCSLFIAQILPRAEAVDALRAVSQIVSSHQIVATALVRREGRAVLSPAWLGTGRDLIRRACSVAVHGAGHLLGLRHCNGKCAMKPASSLKGPSSPARGAGPRLLG
jgi:hypothetical protein